ncbi:Poly [ADP-ribose] polymerase tankyrase [Gryllus bimaculatus]|nr:Poly [ADP-ribose] polymerase tankyrase [Gryllus bimaculatus]
MVMDLLYNFSFQEYDDIFLVFSNSNAIVINSTASSCSSFESIVEEIYDAAKRACWTGSTPLVKYMLENGADVSLRSSVGDSAFYLAVHKIVKDKTQWDPSLLKLLYKSGCCVNARRLHGYTPLHLAADYGHAPLVGWLLSHGADPSATAVCGAKPVDLALLKGHAAVVDMLTIRVHDVPCSPVLPVEETEK